MVRPWNDVIERDEPAARFTLREPVAASELQPRLHRFGAAVAEERARQSGQGREPRRQFSLQRMEEQVRRVKRASLCLVGDRSGQSRMRVPQRCDADAGNQIEITSPILCRKGGSHDRDRRRPGRGGTPAAHVPFQQR